MKKRFLTLLFSLLCVFCLSVPVFADSGMYFFGDIDLSEDVEDELNQRASELSDKYGVYVTCLVFDGTTEADGSEYSSEIYQENFGDEDGIMLTYDYGNSTWWLYKSGSAEQIEEADEDALWEVFAEYPEDGDAIEAYLDCADDVLSGYYSANELPMDVNKPVVSAEAQLPRLVDEAGVLSEDEQTELLELLDEISERQKFDVVVATVDSTEGQAIRDYADDFFDYNGYGYGPNEDGIVLMIDMGARNWWMSTKGYGITAMTDAGLQYIKDQFLDDLSDGDYFDAFKSFAKCCDKFVTEAREGEPYDEGHMPFAFLSPIWILGALIIGFIPAIIIALFKRSKLKSVHEERLAAAYARPDSLNITNQWDRYINSIVTHHEISHDDDGGGGGGSSTHTSSSGDDHGGCGGSF